MSRHSCIFSLVTVLVLVLLVGLPAGGWAQQTTGGLTGLVTDPQGGVLPGAKADVVGVETGLKRSQVSGNDGYYAFANLPIGHYTLTVSHDGFQTEVFPNISVEAGRTGTVNAALSLRSARS